MKQFFKIMLASMSGCLISGIILIFIFVGVISGISSLFSTDNIKKVEDGTVLRIKLDKPLLDRTISDEYGFGAVFGGGVGMGLDDFMKNIKKAETDPNIEGVFLDLTDYAGMNTAMSYEVRQALVRFKESGKFIVAYSDSYSQGAYWLASVADNLYLNPVGGIDLKGLATQSMFFKGLIEKLDIEPQIIRHGKFKSAIEPFILDKMSEANKEQTSMFVNSIWNTMLGEISKSRNIPIDELTKMTNDLVGYNRKEVQKTKLIDKVLYRDQVEDELKALTSQDVVKYVSMETYTKSISKKAAKKKLNFEDKIAVIYAIGEIGPGMGDDHVIGSERISKAIREARENNKVKAIVLRVNSPGGSALASEIIRREVVRTKGLKPIIVSMGDMAASGGYWISCSADSILADPTTITGSIGVFGVIPNFKEMFNKKLGITFDGVKTDENADIYSVVQPLTPYQREVIQASVEDWYQQFIEIVAEGRKMTTAQVDSIGQGRVWSGADALRIGLVDKMGGLEDAIAVAARCSNLTDYTIVTYPRTIDPFEKIKNKLEGREEEDAKLQFMLGKDYKYIKTIRSIINSEDKIQARLPFEVELY